MEIKAIDIHVHPPVAEMNAAGGDLALAAARSFGIQIDEPIAMPLEAVAQDYESQGIMAVLLGWDAESGTGNPRYSNDDVASAVSKFPDIFMGFASVDPWKGKMAISEAKRAVNELGLKGFKFQQCAQAFRPNDHQFYPLWEAIADLGVPALFHMGTTGFGAGTRGGMGIKLDYARPIYVDDVAADFPEMDIILAHPGWPWESETLAVAMHKANCYLDLSGWSPKRFSRELVRALNRELQNRALFGTDYPMIHPTKWFESFDTLEILPETRQKVILDNARKLLAI